MGYCLYKFWFLAVLFWWLCYLGHMCVVHAPDGAAGDGGGKGIVGLAITAFARFAFLKPNKKHKTFYYN